MMSIEYENLQLVNKPFFSSFKEAFNNVTDSGWYILGKEVESFEAEFSRYLGAKSSIGVASGLDALTLSLRAAALPAGSEVIVPSNTYIATILSILHNNLVPVLVEPHLETYNIDANRIEEKITSKTSAIMIVHLYGLPCEMRQISALVDKYSLLLIEDCAQAHGASYHGQKVGTFGVGAFSFYPTKNLGALGDGGAISVNCPEFRQKLVSLRNYGSTQKYHNDVIGFNSRLDELQAAFLRIKLKHLDEINQHKAKLAQLYFEGLNDRYILPHRDQTKINAYHIFPIRHRDRDRDRDSLRQYLLKSEIKTEIHYPIPPHKQSALQHILDGSYPISEEIHSTVLSLPISYCHSESDIIRVIEVLNDYKK